MTRRLLALLGLSLCAAFAVACASLLRDAGDAPLNAAPSDAARANAQATVPPGAQGKLIRLGYDIIADTRNHAGQYVRADMSCAACHPSGGTQSHAGSLLGTYAKFPQWNRRARRFIALQDRIAECFLYSMNGRPPAYYSHEMVAITAYIAWLSRGAKTGEGFAGQEAVKVRADRPPDRDRGAQIFAARCTTCHGADGQGRSGRYPPLWGPRSFNDKAGMSRMDRMAPFVRVAMPQNAPGTLSDQQAADVSAFVLAHPRPHFDGSQLVRFPAERAAYF
ncbi:MAG: cytochrome C [Candidatus Eremiobacter antarcticus]|nr:c-type cytochrome [Candidatus Eremiobacteraeota bacterium]MBC5807193.1 c-type cytochrome [Candidatus Eremiobacteraeota bacterium]PZR60984.1 MAG: cytochrome C [Candidatus Eremiobacter sp. RRmetagenome_bin22]